MKYKVIAFDWDGTLVDSVDHIVSSMKQAAQQMTLECLSDEAVRNIIGLGMEEAIKTLYSDLSAKDITVFRSHYSDAFFATEVGVKHLFPNVNELLCQLSSKGLVLAVATGKSRRGLDIALNTTGLKRHFSIERCADETKSKPHPLMLHEIMSSLDIRPAEMLMVGDTDFDMEMAQEFEFRRKRGAHLFSKHRFLSAQMAGYLQGDLWRETARQANANAAYLAEGLCKAGAAFLHAPQANMLFPRFPRAIHRKLHEAGAKYYLWDGRLDGPEDSLLAARMVCDWSISKERIDQFLSHF